MAENAQDCWKALESRTEVWDGVSLRASGTSPACTCSLRSGHQSCGEGVRVALGHQVWGKTWQPRGDEHGPGVFRSRRTGNQISGSSGEGDGAPWASGMTTGWLNLGAREAPAWPSWQQREPWSVTLLRQPSRTDLSSRF